jgi:NADPH:quinone reductase-like Zn-dependent oxidoreductase
MKTYHVENPGSIDGLALRDDPERQPGPNEVCVRIRAASLNFRDLLIVRGQYPVPGLRKDIIPVSDGAGEVTAAGAAVRRVKVGDRVAVNFHQNWIDGPICAGYMSSDLGGSIDGLLAESVILSEEGLVHLPSHLSFEEGAAFGCATITAWASLVSGVALRAGHTLLVQGTGGVSIFALQFAKAFGARVIATTSSEAKAKTLRALGADEVINYVATPAWDAAVRELTNGQGVDRVVEVGGPGTLERSIRSTNIGGRVALVGFVGGMAGAISPLLMAGGNITLEAIAVGSRRNFEDSLAVVAQHRIRPAVDRVFSFEQAREAYRYLDSRAHVGKVVIASSYTA